MDFYTFSKDGTFSYQPYSQAYTVYEGKYSISNGKLYLKNLVYRDKDTNEVEEMTNPNKVMEFKIVKDSGGEHLQIGCLQDYRNAATVDMAKADKYKRGK